jgi:hypothetical protein
MLRCAMLAAAGVLFLSLATEARAQIGQAGPLNFVPVDTTKNVATPFPVIQAPQPQGSYFDRLYTSLGKILPFPRRNRQPNLPSPGMPTIPSQPAVTQTPSTPSSGSIFKLPSIPSLFSAGAK